MRYVLQSEDHVRDNRKPLIDMLITIRLLHLYPNIFTTFQSLQEDLSHLHFLILRGSRN